MWKVEFNVVAVVVCVALKKIEAVAVDAEVAQDAVCAPRLSKNPNTLRCAVVRFVTSPTS